MVNQSSEFVSSRSIGEATITTINDGGEWWSPELTAPKEEWIDAIPGMDSEQRVYADTHVLHIRLSDASILVDAGLDDPSSRWWQERAAQMPEAASARTPGVQAGLETIGVHPEDITHVLITHSHYDHIIGITVERDGMHAPRYPNARVLIGRADWEGNAEREDPNSDLSIRLGTIERAGLLELVDGDREVVPGVTMIHAPGESPGHSIVRVISGGEQFFALGDLFHIAPEVEHLDWNVTWANPETMRASRQRLIDEAVAPHATLMFTHEVFPPWGTIVRSGNGYRWVRG
jgi:glyoxylase-like metal-dependent hydrolase (beta-lactamase superfamily II)